MILGEKNSISEFIQHIHALQNLLVAYNCFYLYEARPTDKNCKIC
jgi:hypothetical protein